MSQCVLNFHLTEYGLPFHYYTLNLITLAHLFLYEEFFMSHSLASGKFCCFFFKFPVLLFCLAKPPAKIEQGNSHKGIFQCVWR